MTNLTWKEQLVVHPPSATAFITGAGISADSPTNGPVGAELMRRSLRVGFLPGTQEFIDLTYTQLGIDPATRPRLEAVLEIVQKIHGSSVLDSLLNDLQTARPNALHQFFAEHLRLGGTHATANFDGLIETAAGRPPARITHFHGSLAEGAASLGATLSSIERGFEEAMRDRLQGQILASEIKNLVIVGYSGLDYFDMNPFLRGAVAAGMLDGMRVTLLQHDPLQRVPQYLADPAQQRALWPFRRTQLGRGPEFECLAGATTVMLSHYAVEWEIPGPIARQRIWVDPVDITVSPRQMARATAHLYAHMGLFTGLDTLSAWSADIDSNIRSQREWARAQYRSYSRIARAGRPGTRLTDQMDRLNTLTRTHWIRGSYLRACLSGRKPLAIARQLMITDVPEYLDALELRGRILVHMRRCPDVRWLARRALRREVINEIESFQRRNPRLGVDARVRINSVLADLDHDSKATAGDVGKWDEAISTLDEFESLSSRLQYEHGRLRKAIDADINTVKLDDFQRLARQFATIGQIESELRVRLLPGSAYAFPLCDTMRRVSELDATLWHRFRLLLGLLRERCLLRSRRIRKV